MIQIIVEDGSGVPTANSYGTIAEFRAYTLARGITLPASDDEVAALLIQAYEFIPSYECRFGGVRSFPGVQTNAFPRDCLFIQNVLLSNTAVPLVLKTAQFQIAIAAENGVTLFPTQTGPGIKRETVGPLTTEYDTASWIGSELPVLSNVELTLSVLFKDTACGGIKLRTIRA